MVGGQKEPIKDVKKVLLYSLMFDGTRFITKNFTKLKNIF